MKNGEITPHWEELVNTKSESVTDVKIELASTWVQEVTSQMVEDTPFENDINLQLSRSYDASRVANPSSSIPESPPPVSEGD